MAIKSRRAYKGAAVSNTLSSPLNNTTDFTISLSTPMSGFDTSGTPFFCVIDPGTSKEEKVCVIYTSASVLTCVDPAVTSGWTGSVNGRGVDNTVIQTHIASAVIYPVFTAFEADQANELVSKYASTGGMVYQDASSFASLALGTSGYPLLAGASAPAYGQVTATGIADGAVTSAKILDGSIVNADINASAAIAYSKLNLATSIVNGDISASAAIALSKLATTGTVTATTFVGALTGNVTGNVTGSVTGTASGNLVSGGALGTPSSGNLANCTFPTLNQSTNQNAATATALQTARNIGGVSFNGTANISLPGVDAAGTQNTSGNASTATALVGMAKASSVVPMNFGFADVPHGMGSTPSTAIIVNGDTTALNAAFIINVLDATNIRIAQVGGTYTGSVRVNWIAFA